MTYINTQVQLFCFLMCIACDVLEWLNYHNFVKKFRQIKDGVYASIGVPSCLAVFVTFWVLFLIDRELVYPKRLDKYLPVWANHVWRWRSLPSETSKIKLESRFFSVSVFYRTGRTNSAELELA